MCSRSHFSSFYSTHGILTTLPAPDNPRVGVSRPQFEPKRSVSSVRRPQHSATQPRCPRSQAAGRRGVEDACFSLRAVARNAPSAFFSLFPPILPLNGLKTAFTLEKKIVISDEELLAFSSFSSSRSRLLTFPQQTTGTGHAERNRVVTSTKRDKEEANWFRPSICQCQQKLRHRIAIKRIFSAVLSYLTVRPDKSVGGKCT